MEPLSWTLFALSWLVSVCSLWLVWHQCKALRRARRLLARSEEARFQLRRHAQAIEARLASADTELVMHRQLAAPTAEGPASVPPPSWDDTQPFDGLEPGFLITQPGARGSRPPAEPPQP
jgi:hypothetical protein